MADSTAALTAATNTLRAAPAPSAAARRAATQLEAALASTMIGAARGNAGQDKGPFGGGAGARAFDSFMNEALGQAMASQKPGLRLAKSIERSIQSRGIQRTPQ